MNELKVIYPGTFDPITIGHLEIIRRAARVFKHIIVGVANDTAKNTIFSLSERQSMAQKDIEMLKLKHCNVEVKQFSGLLTDFAEVEKVGVIIRGLRNAADFEYEFQMAYVNSKINSSLETIFICANEKGHFISSKFVKELAKLGGNIENFVSYEVAQKLYAHFNTL